MDLTVKDWLIIIGGLLALAVLLDGYRRMRSERRDTIRVSSRKSRNDVDEDMINPELPSGSARVIAVREKPSLHVKRGDSSSQNQSLTSVEKADASKPRKHKSERNKPEFDDDDDILFRDPSEEYGAIREARDGDVEKKLATAERARSSQAPASLSSESAPSATEIKASEPALSRPGVSEPETPESDDISRGITANHQDRAVAVEPPEHIAASRRADEPKRAAAGTVSGEKKSDYQELMVLNVLSPTDKPFNGAEMLQILLACDVRYGKMNIFHRYEKSDGTGPVQFSIANLVEPGDFDLDGIEEFTTPGLVFFMHLPGPKNSIKAFDAMLETARCLINNLGGELRDQTHSVATKQTLEHYRQRIRDFERRQLTLM